METPLLYEIIGYVASVLIAVSLMMSRILPLRMINLVGAGTFAVYGYLIGSIPVAAMNSFIVLINIYYLLQIYRSREYLRILEVFPESEYLKYFLNFYHNDIRKYQPDFNADTATGELNLFVLRNTVPAGAITGNLSNGRLSLKLDFVSPQYRDFKIAHFLYVENKTFFAEKGIREIEAATSDAGYSRYLQKVGFVSTENQPGRFIKKI